MKNALMRSDTEAIRHFERGVTAPCIGQFDDPDDPAFTVIQFKKGEHITNISLSRRRLRQIARNDAKALIASARALIHRRV